MKPYNLLGWYWRALKSYATFKGRATMSEFFGFLLMNIIIIICVPLAIHYLDDLGIVAEIVTGTLSFIWIIYILGNVVPFYAVTVRRLHDTNHSGWWYFIAIIPIIGHLILLLFIASDGTTGPNRFGEDPKGRKAPVPVTKKV